MSVDAARRWRQALVWLLAICGVAACATTATHSSGAAPAAPGSPATSSSNDSTQLSNGVHQTAVAVGHLAAKAAAATQTQAAAAYQRMQHYLAEKDVLKTFTDAGEHSESELLTVLHRSRVGTAGSAGAASTAPTAKSKSAGTGTPASVARVPAALPQQYGGSLRWPLDAGIVSSEYGERWGKMHKGIDIAADSGEPVYAIADGEVIYAGDGMRGYGNVVIIQHDSRMTSLYAHNSALKVSKGDKVSKGTEIALLGSTGHSTGPHVHFEIREDDGAVNPRTLLPKSNLADAEGPPGGASKSLLVQR